jgi:hypothetical protein
MSIWMVSWIILVVLDHIGASCIILEHLVSYWMSTVTTNPKRFSEWHLVQMLYTRGPPKITPYKGPLLVSLADLI